MHVGRETKIFGMSAVSFSSNRSIPLNVEKYSCCYDLNQAIGLTVLGSRTGSLLFTSDCFEFELENPLDHQSLTTVFISDVYGIVVTLSTDVVQVWDCFRVIEGRSFSSVHKVVTPNKPTSLFRIRGSNIFYIGFQNGKVQTMDVAACVNILPTPKFSSVPFCDVGSAATCIASFESSHLMFGTCEGVVKVMKLETKKLAWTIKGPQSGLEVRSISAVIPTSGSTKDCVQMVISYNAPVLALVSNGSILHVVKTFTEPARYAFTHSVSSSDDSPIILRYDDNRLVRLDGPKWSHASVVSESCLSLKSCTDNGSHFLTLEKSPASGIVELKRMHLTTGLGPIETLPSPSMGILSMSALGDRLPVQSIGLPRSDRSLEPHLIRLCNALTNNPQSPMGGFVFDFNAGLWEGVIVSVFNHPCELVFSIYTSASVRVLKRLPIQAPHLAAVSTFAIDVMGQDKWSILLGFTSGQVGILESTLDYPSPGLCWKNLWTLEAPEQVHSGAKIVHVDRSLFGRNLVTSVDVNGMICFTRIDENEHDVNFSKSLSPAHVAIGGEGGNAFPDPNSNSVYIAIAGGGIEKIKTPKFRKDGSEDLHDSEIWSASTVVDFVPLSGKCLKLFASEGFVVYSDGIASLTFQSKSGSQAKLTGVVNLSSGEFGTEIFDAQITEYENKVYLVVMTESHVVAYDKNGRSVYHRLHTEDSKNIGNILAGTLHVFKWGMSLTGISFSDRKKLLSNTELVIRGAQKKLGFPPIKGVPFAEQIAQSKEETISETSSVGEKKKGLFKRTFSSKKHDLSDEKFKPTNEHLAAARAQLQKNLDAMAKLQDSAAEMENSSAEFLSLAKQLTEKERKKSKKFLGLF